MSFHTLPDDFKERAQRIKRDGLSVTMPDGSIYTFHSLLTLERGNLKLSKSAGTTYYSVGLSLAPWKLAGMGNLCAGASKECIAGCLNTSGRGTMYMAQRARIARTRAALSRDREIRADFISLLVSELETYARRSHRNGLILAARLNVYSDLAWETMAPWLFTRFQHVRFYDYTKIIGRLGRTPANYDLTFSRSEVNEPDAIAALDAGFRVAVVFNRNKPLPRKYLGRKVINGDRHDLRFTEPGRVIVGLVAKGKIRNSSGAFVV